MNLKNTPIPRPLEKGDREIAREHSIVANIFSWQPTYTIFSHIHYVDVKWPPCGIELPVNRVFVKHFVQTDNKEISKVRVYCPLCVGNVPVPDGFPAQRDSNAENVSIWWRHNVYMQLCCTLLCWGSSICAQWFQVMYRQVSDISGTLVGNQIIDHSNVVGASPVGAAPTTSSFSTKQLASLDWTKTTARLE